MKDTFIQARLVSPDLIRLVIFSSVPFDRLEAKLIRDRKDEENLNIVHISSTASTIIADFHAEKPIELGHSYALHIPSYGFAPLDVSEATTFPDFDSKYTYSGHDLGSIYTPTATVFTLWAPLASDVLLKICKKGESAFVIHKMKREAKGIFRLTLAGDYELARYHFLVTNCEVTVDTTDPYAKCSTANGEDSVVANFAKLKEDFHKDSLPVMNSYSDAIIYEGSVRDLTIDKHSDIVAKGTYAGLIERGRKTTHGMPAGFDYLCSLGITHLQLLPIFDFKTVNEKDPASGYNWGYDPAQYFVPEGSYSSKPNDPYARIKEVQRMVSTFHKAGIRIVMDVVFNHVFNYLNNSLEKVVPNFYFRRRHDGKMANTSGCGDDLASERPMVGRLIYDACEWWIRTYGIDGFRFDLMGIIDTGTLDKIQGMASSLDQHFICYGEGWNMGGDVNVPLGYMSNYRLLPRFAFFNDRYRDTTKKWITSPYGNQNEFKFVYVSSSVDFYDKPKFLNANQSLNYIECHDNGTVYDFVDSQHPDYSIQDKLSICKLGFATV
jgi:pullulanase